VRERFRRERRPAEHAMTAHTCDRCGATLVEGKTKMGLAAWKGIVHMGVGLCSDTRFLGTNWDWCAGCAELAVEMVAEFNAAGALEAIPVASEAEIAELRHRHLVAAGAEPRGQVTTKAPTAGPERHQARSDPDAAREARLRRVAKRLGLGVEKRNGRFLIRDGKLAIGVDLQGRPDLDLHDLGVYLEEFAEGRS
jgi:hypothetical protein